MPEHFLSFIVEETPVVYAKRATMKFAEDLVYLEKVGYLDDQDGWKHKSRMNNENDQEFVLDASHHDVYLTQEPKDHNKYNKSIET